jgi:pyridoxamine 5'-phosphate oxidase family protein
MFTESEIQYLKSQTLGRIATVSRDGQPDVVPVAFEVDGNYIWIGSRTQEIFKMGKRYFNVTKGNNKVAFVVDDLVSVNPFTPRSIKIYGTAEITDHTGRFGPGKYLKITPNISWSLGINGPMPNYNSLQSGQTDWRTKTVH